jgi:hypothetical protein
MIEKFAFTEPERYWHYLHHLIPNNPFLVSALDMAGWDLFGKIKGKLLYQLWNTEFVNTPPTDYTIGIDSSEQMVAKIKAKPHPIYKIKLGFDGDVEVIAELRKHTNSIFRVDANAGWSLDEAMQNISVLKDLGVIEFKLGFSHLKKIKIPVDEISVHVQKSTLFVEGRDCVLIGNFLNKIRSLKVPDIYKGKGFWYKYQKEHLKIIKKK